MFHLVVIISIYINTIFVLQVSAHGFNDTIDKNEAGNSWKQQMDAKTGTDASHCVLLEFLIRHCNFDRYLSK